MFGVGLSDHNFEFMLDVCICVVVSKIFLTYICCC